MTSVDETPHGDAVDALAHRTGFTVDAVATMRRALVRGGGRMAQFDHPAFGGPGQWMHGGMLMLTDPGDRPLRERVGALCEALAASLSADGAAGSVDAAVSADDRRLASQSQWQSSAGGRHAGDDGAHWWPASLGRPDTSGAQDGSRYAWFAASGRLAVTDGGRVTVYDTGDQRLVGVSQAQGGGRTVVFTGQGGPIDLARLPVVDAGDPASAPEPSGGVTGTASSGADPFVALEKLALLHARGIVTDAEFAAKKAELLRRI